MKVFDGRRPRVQLRMKAWDYRNTATYFVTICARQRVAVFGDVVDGRMVLNAAGKTVYSVWNDIPEHFPNVELDEFVVMPDHFHALIRLKRVNPDDVKCDVGARHASPLRAPSTHAVPPGAPSTHAVPPDATPSCDANGEYVDGIVRGFAPASLASVIASFKSAVTKRINIARNTPGVSVWQRNYYERVIRDEYHLEKTRIYVRDNPAAWDHQKNKITGVGA